DVLVLQLDRLDRPYPPRVRRQVADHLEEQVGVEQRRQRRAGRQLVAAQPPFLAGLHRGAAALAHDRVAVAGPRPQQLRVPAAFGAGVLVAAASAQVEPAREDVVLLLGGAEGAAAEREHLLAGLVEQRLALGRAGLGRLRRQQGGQREREERGQGAMGRG